MISFHVHTIYIEILMYTSKKYLLMGTEFSSLKIKLEIGMKYIHKIISNNIIAYKKNKQTIDKYKSSHIQNNV